jgi:hypothetical protein
MSVPGDGPVKAGDGPVTARRAALAAALCGLLALGAVGAEAPRGAAWLGLPGVLAAIAVLWRPTRWLAGLVGLSVLALAFAGGLSASTAVLAGVALVGSALLADLSAALDQPDLAATVDPSRPPAGGSAGRAPGWAPGWARCVGPPWLAGAVGGVALVLVTVWASGAHTPAEWVVAATPLLAVLAGWVAIGRNG